MIDIFHTILSYIQHANKLRTDVWQLTSCSEEEEQQANENYGKIVVNVPVTLCLADFTGKIPKGYLWNEEKF